MTGIIRAEWLRLRKRGTLLLVATAVPFLAVIFFGLGWASIYDPGTFDAQQLRQSLIDQGYVLGLPPDEAERQLDEYVENERNNHVMQVEQVKLARASYVFPQSLVTILGNASFALLALALLTASTMGDEFGWGTIRTTLLASSARWRVLIVRLGALWLTAALIYALLLVAGSLAPVFLGSAGRPLPSPFPQIDVGALTVFLVGLLLAAFVIIAFATLSTVVLRHGALTLMSVLVYVVVEGAILALLTRFKEFGIDVRGRPGELRWMLDFLPGHGLATLLDVGSRASSAILRYDGDELPATSGMAVSMIGFAAWGTLFALLGLFRFRRMDIVE